MKTKATSRRADPARQRTNVPGQNPKADDAPDKDLYHDENRRNLFDSEVAESLGGLDQTRRRAVRPPGKREKAGRG